jgi:glucosyl-dolichyl phosphate glucuronosyltransferase
MSEIERSVAATIAIVTRDRAASLERALRSALDQDFETSSFEVVVVDDGSDDDTEAVVEALKKDSGGPEVHYRYQAAAGVNTARNAAQQVARGGVVAFLDDDEEASPTWLARIVEAFSEHPDAGCVGGPMLTDPSLRPPRTCSRCDLRDGHFDLPGDEPRAVGWVLGGNMALAKWAIESVGPFDERVTGIGDDADWMRRARSKGVPIWFLPAVPVVHHRTQTQYRLSYLCRRAYRRGRETARYAAHLGEPYRASEQLRRLPRSLAHAVVFRCWSGVIRAVGLWGEGVGAWDAARETS